MNAKGRLIEAMKERLKRDSRSNLLAFTFSTMPTFVPAPFHRTYYGLLNDFLQGKCKKMMVFMPPQHGKSEGSTRRLPAALLGVNPDTRIAVISYSASKAMKFNREIQRIMDSPEYREIFPNTMLPDAKSGVKSQFVRNSSECEVVGHEGGFKTVGVGGPLTGDPVDVLIMDDLYKDAKTAWSATIRESVSDWYDTVAETRLHNNSRQLIVFTRWHQDDLAGKLLRQQGEYDPDTNPDGWKVITFPAIATGKVSDYDTREEGEPLWPDRHSLKKLLSVRARNPQVFESLYQQDPKPFEGLMYTNLRTYSTLPAECSKKAKRKNYTDTADTGADYLCSVCYIETPTAMYITDVLYTQKPMEDTEPETARMLTKNGTDYAHIESNNGGRAFARNVEKNLRLLGNMKTAVYTFTQTANKEIRIFTHSAEVQNVIYFPEGWEYKFPDFFNAVTGHRKEGKNEHDDAPDVLTGMIEKFEGQLYPELNDADYEELEDAIY